MVSVCEDETEALCDAGILGLSIKTYGDQEEGP